MEMLGLLGGGLGRLRHLCFVLVRLRDVGTLPGCMYTYVVVGMIGVDRIARCRL